MWIRNLLAGLSVVGLSSVALADATLGNNVPNVTYYPTNGQLRILGGGFLRLVEENTIAVRKIIAHAKLGNPDTAGVGVFQKLVARSKDDSD